VAVLFSDPFDVLGNPDPTLWVENVGGWGVSSGVLNNSASTNGQFTNIITLPLAHAAILDVKVSVKRSSTNWNSGPMVRVSGSGSGVSCYYASIVSGSATVTIFRHASGAHTAVGAAITGFTGVSGDVYTLEVSGTGPVTLRLYQNGNLLGERTDSGAGILVVAGQTGIESWSNTGTYDDFLVEDLVVPATLTQVSYQFRNDDGDEDGATPKAAENTPVTVTPGSTFRMRILVDADQDPASADFQGDFRKVGDATWKKLNPS
jgi:hypothetical protein